MFVNVLDSGSEVCVTRRLHLEITIRVMATSLSVNITALSTLYLLVILILVIPQLPQRLARRLHLLCLEAGLDHIEGIC